MNELQTVLIVGAGPTGLSLALFLHHLGVPFRIIEKNQEISPLTKALGMQPRTLEIFERFDLAQEFLDAGRKLEQINIYVKGKVATSLSYQGLDTHFPFPLIIGQNETEAILAKRLKRLKVKIERDTELISLHQNGKQVYAIVQKEGEEQEELISAFVIGCDGAHSAVRHQCGISFQGSEYLESFSLCDATLRSPYAHDAMHVFTTEKGPVALFPFKEHKKVRIIISHPPGHENTKAFIPVGHRFEQTTFLHSPLSVEDMKRHLVERGLEAIVIEKAEWISDFRVNKRIATKWRHGRVLLAGDAAHIHSPMGGQGMNTGIQDAWNLAWKLKFVLAGGKEALLDNYAKERHYVGKQVLNTSDKMTRAMVAKAPWIVRLRNFVLTHLFSRPFFKKLGAHRLSQLFISYPSGLTVHKDYFQQGGIPAGMQAIDRNIGKTTLFKTLDTRRFTCLIFTGQERGLSAIHEAIAVKNRLKNHLVKCVILSTEDHIDEDVFKDHEGACHKLYGAGGAHLTLIRPDGYIALQHDNYGLEAIEVFLKKLA